MNDSNFRAETKTVGSWYTENRDPQQGTGAEDSFLLQIYA